MEDKDCDLRSFKDLIILGIIEIVESLGEL